MSNPVLRYIGQAVVYSGFAALVWYFSIFPTYQPLPDGHAQIKMSFAHGGKPVGGCRDRTSDELSKLAPNMRKTQECARQRVPVVVQFSLNNEEVFSASLPASGFRGDGASKMYEKFVVPAGRHQLAFKLRDSERDEGFDYELERMVNLVPGQSFAIDFDAQLGGFVFH